MERPIESKRVRVAFMILLIAVIVQGFHMVEHVAQIQQKFVLNLPMAHGVLGEFWDLEPVHFAYNLAYLILISLVWLGLKKSPLVNVKAPYWLLLFAIVFQSWHFVEHAVKLDFLHCIGIINAIK